MYIVCPTISDLMAFLAEKASRAKIYAEAKAEKKKVKTTKVGNFIYYEVIA